MPAPHILCFGRPRCHRRRGLARLWTGTYLRRHRIRAKVPTRTRVGCAANNHHNGVRVLYKRLDLPPRQQNFPGLRRGASLPRGGRGDYFPRLQCVYVDGVSLGGGFLVTRCRRNDKWRPHTSRTTCRVTHGRVGRGLAGNVVVLHA